MNELVSIITPSYNTEKYIVKTIQSVLAQTYQYWEMIIVDDCSTDQTEKVIADYLKDSRIRFLKNESNLGAAMSRNRALREAKGKWIAFLDSDDLWMPDKLQKQIDFMNAHDYHFSYTNYLEIDAEGNSRGICWTGPKKVGRMRMTMYDYVGCLTVMYDAEKVGLIQIANLKKRNDYAMWMKVVKKCPAYLLDETLSCYRIRFDSILDRKKNPIHRLKYSYQVWSVAEEKGTIVSLFLTGVNIIFGSLKKVVYRRKEK